MKYCTASRKQFVLLAQMRVKQMVPDWNEVVEGIYGISNSGCIYWLTQRMLLRILVLWGKFWKSEKFFAALI